MSKDKSDISAAVSTPDTDANPIPVDTLHPKTVALLTNNKVLAALHKQDQARDAVLRAKQELQRRDAELALANDQLHHAVKDADSWAAKMLADIGLVGK
jgi:hypothetical protein